MGETLRELDVKLKSLYVDFREASAILNTLSSQIKELEDKRIAFVETDGRKLGFSKPVIALRKFKKDLSLYNWIEIEYEGFEKENLNPLITEEALIASVYFYQSNYNSKVKVTISMDGYLNEEEYNQIRLEQGEHLLPEYRRKK